MIYVVGSGGKGGFPSNKALLRITAETGSEIELWNGSTKVTTLGSGDGHTLASNTSMADWYYSVPTTSANWKAVAKKSGDSAEETKAVSAARQYDYELLYGNYMIRNGALQNVTWATPTGVYGTAEIVDHTGYVELKQARNDYGLDAYGLFYFSEKVNLSSYSSFNVKWQQTTSEGILLAANTTTTIDVGTKTSTVTTAGSTVTTTLDISSLSGSYYIGFKVFATNNNNSAYVYNAWLE